MKRTILALSILSLLALPTLVFADAGHAADAPHGNAVVQGGSVHIHDDGTVESHGAGGSFELATPWSPRWWMLMGISLILMGFLSIWVKQYLQV